MPLERRLSIRMVSYWDRLRKENPLPPYEKLRRESLSDIWGSSIIFTVSKRDKHLYYQYLHVGEDIRQLIGSGMVGQEVMQNPNFLPLKPLVVVMDDVIRNPRALEHNGQFVDMHGHMTKYRSCILPFGRDEQHVSHCMVGLTWTSLH